MTKLWWGAPHRSDDDNDVVFVASADMDQLFADMDLHGVSLFGQWVPHLLHL